MTRDEAIRKVLRCLRLAKSSNPNEAATALRQARKLMDEYGVNEADAAAAEYSEQLSKTCGRGQALPASIITLLNLVARGFRCEPVIVGEQRYWDSPITHRVAFVGRGSDPTVAVYAFDVLRRQLDRDRLKHIARTKKRANREARGEAFALGWVAAVQGLFPAAELTDEERQALQIAKRKHYPDTSLADSKQIAKGKVRDDDRYAGLLAGRQARLHAGVTGEGQRRLGHG